MTERFDPNVPPGQPTDPAIEGEFIGTVVISEPAALGRGNLVVDRSRPFDVEVEWRVFGNMVPLWLTAVGALTPSWEVKAYAESQGPGDEKLIGKVDVPIGGPPYGMDKHYAAKITVPAGTLSAELPDPAHPGEYLQSGVYKIIVTTFLNSQMPDPGFDMMGYADGPIIKVEE